MAVFIPSLEVKQQQTIHTLHKGYVYAISAVVALGGILFGFDLVIISGTVPFLQTLFSTQTKPVPDGQ